MKASMIRRLLFAGLLACGSSQATASDACSTRATQQAATELARRIATTACAENTLWFNPFIDSNGRLASTRVAEAESARLADQATPAWLRVVDYWKQSGLLWSMGGFPGSSECSYAGESHGQKAACRAFVIDNPWSAVFISWVMQQSGVPGFRSSPSHIDYVRDAYAHPDSSPFRFTDPDAEQPAIGDLLCFVRAQSSVFGYDGLKAYLGANPGVGLQMHCDVAVALDAGTLSLVGGNVLQGVTMRLLHVNREGMLWGLPRRSGVDVGCSPSSETACNFNRQDWAVLLKLKPLSPMAQVRQLPRPAAQPACCVKCLLGADPPVPRCPQASDMQLP